MGKGNTPRGGELAARIRAARGYAGLKQPELAAALGVSVETMSRMENGRTTIPETTLRAVGEACGVPDTFMRAGFAPLAKPMTETEVRLLDLERDMGERLDRIEQALAQRATRDPLLDELVEGGRRGDAIIKDALGDRRSGDRRASGGDNPSDNPGEVDEPPARREAHGAP